MGIRTIRTEKDPCLYKVCREVTNFNRKLEILIEDMFDTMYKADGVGLAAPQIGVLRRVVVIDDGERTVELINPEIIAQDGLQRGYEGCLSFPGKSGYVERPNHVVVRACDRTGAVREYEGEGLFARAVCHELDHLDGKVYLDLVTEPPEDFVEQNSEEE
ncbi:MAG: peptide deformylase [Clostridia bacterium]|nr:peptide deformylase [Clostridia bacterium]